MNTLTVPSNTRDRLAIGDAVTVPIQAQAVWNRTGIHLIAGQEYRFTAVGEWKDWYIPCDADGFFSLNLFFSAAEWLRREPAESWFSLIGAVDCKVQTQFRIGTERTHIMPVSGMLTCFANDVFFAYWNNSGTLQLTVTRTG